MQFWRLSSFVREIEQESKKQEAGCKAQPASFLIVRRFSVYENEIRKEIVIIIVMDIKGGRRNDTYTA